MNILENILVVLNDDPDGELPVSEVKSRVSERLTDPKRIAENMRAARDSNRLGSVPRKELAQSTEIFGRLISHPHKGVWKITDAGRSYLRSLDALPGENESSG